MRFNRFMKRRLFDTNDGGEGGGGAGGGDPNADKKDKSALNDDKGGKPSDKEAELLKDVMKKKERIDKLSTDLKAQADKAAELEGKLKAFDGINLDQVKELLTAKAKADEDAALKRGEFDRVKGQMVEEHTKALNGLKSETEKTIADLTAKLSASTNQIVELTIGRAFGDSQFVRESLTLTPAKARVVFGSHFELQDGRVVAYDKPTGADKRTLLVDGNGDPLSFDKAIEKIVEADSDKDQLLRSKMKSGAGSKSDKDNKQDPEVGSGRDRIRNSLSGSGFKLLSGK